MCRYKYLQLVCITVLACHMEYCLKFFTDSENLLKDTLHAGVQTDNCFAILTYDTKSLSMQRTDFKHWR